MPKEPKSKSKYYWRCFRGLTNKTKTSPFSIDCCSVARNSRWNILTFTHCSIAKSIIHYSLWQHSSWYCLHLMSVTVCQCIIMAKCCSDSYIKWTTADWTNECGSWNGSANEQKQSLVMSPICCDGSDSQRRANENQNESNQIDTWYW